MLVDNNIDDCSQSPRIGSSLLPSLSLLDFLYEETSPSKPGTTRKRNKLLKKLKGYVDSFHFVKKFRLRHRQHSVNRPPRKGTYTILKSVFVWLGQAVACWDSVSSAAGYTIFARSYSGTSSTQDTKMMEHNKRWNHFSFVSEPRALSYTQDGAHTRYTVTREFLV